MRSVLAASGVLLAASFAVSAATIPCGTGGLNDSGPINIQTGILAVPGFACEQQDKIYSGFNLISGDISGVSVEMFFQPIGSQDNHTVQFSGNLGLAFVLEYDITVDLAISPNNRLKLVGVDINASASGGNPTITKSSPNFATIVASKNTGSAVTTIPDLVTVHVIDSYNPNGGAATSLSNSFVESAPEPATMLLLGSAFVLLGVKRWRKQ
jgi:hypothetical protein